VYLDTPDLLSSTDAHNVKMDRPTWTVKRPRDYR